MGAEKDRQTVTLYVDNIPTSLHWKGLWHTLARHGDVVDAFLANKRNRWGNRFGFVRFGRRVDADRAMERLNGFLLYGSRLSVSLAKYKVRQSYWRKVRPNYQHYTGNGDGKKHVVCKQG
ncbi:hypothetical protein V6N13_118308 [Hibiscus sabdariffa]